MSTLKFSIQGLKRGLFSLFAALMVPLLFISPAYAVTEDHQIFASDGNVRDTFGGGDCHQC